MDSGAERCRARESAASVRAQGQTAAAVESSAYTAVSLYSGAGGLDLGFSRAGFKLLWAADFDQSAVETYSTNLGEHIVCGSLPETEPPRDVRPDLVIGGPPCQGFSVIGRMDPEDVRSQHVFHFLEAVETLQPRAFVLENVKALAVAPRWRPVREKLVRDARALGYEVELFLLNAANYDVPQARERMFLVGLRDCKPRQPRPVTAADPPTVGEVLRALPRVGSPGNQTLCAARVIPAKTPVMRPTAHRGSLLFNGSGRPLDLNGVAKTLPASMGGNATPIVDQEELEYGARPWVIEYHAHLLAGGEPYDKAPPRMRRITVQEAAALQTFPQRWDFKGPQVAQYRQIGNAVPPNLAYHVALSVREALEDIDASQQLLVAAA
jgi:DNA (cytosine-5)-methyltransferase 1